MGQEKTVVDTCPTPGIGYSPIMEKPNIADMLARKRSILDQLEQLSAAERTLKNSEAEVDEMIRNTMKDHGLEKAAGNGLSVTLGDKWRARYEPDKWDSIVAWCVENGRTDLVQRRFADARVMELVDNGTTLPVGLSVESFPSLSFRRVGDKV